LRKEVPLQANTEMRLNQTKHTVHWNKYILLLFSFFLLFSCKKEVFVPDAQEPNDFALPIVRISTNNQPVVSKEEYIQGTFSINTEIPFRSLNERKIDIRGRGNSSWWQGDVWGKKPYQIEFEKKERILGMPEDKRWVLLAEISDKSLLRNRLSRELSQLSTLEFTPEFSFVELVMNDEHQGTYLFGEKVEATESRVRIGEFGFLVEIDHMDRIDADDVYFTSDAYLQINDESVFNIKAPEVTVGSGKHAEIKEHIRKFEEVLFSEDFANPIYGYESYTDVPSFIDWYLINEIGKTVDAQWFSSIFFTYIPGEKIKMGPIWDFDLSFGNVDYADAQYEEGFWIAENPWIKRLLEDPKFKDQVKNRFAHYYSNMPMLLEKMDEYAAYLEDSQKVNYDIWGTLGEKVWPNPVWYDTYEEEVEHLKNWFVKRMDWLNDNL
jgi:spore coat protein CotH